MGRGSGRRRRWWWVGVGVGGLEGGRLVLDKTGEDALHAYPNTAGALVYFQLMWLQCALKRRVGHGRAALLSHTVPGEGPRQ